MRPDTIPTPSHLQDGKGPHMPQGTPDREGMLENPRPGIQKGKTPGVFQEDTGTATCRPNPVPL